MGGSPACYSTCTCMFSAAKYSTWNAHSTWQEFLKWQIRVLLLGLVHVLCLLHPNCIYHLCTLRSFSHPQWRETVIITMYWSQLHANSMLSDVCKNSVEYCDIAWTFPPGVLQQYSKTWRYTFIVLYPPTAITVKLLQAIYARCTKTMLSQQLSMAHHQRGQQQVCIVSNVLHPLWNCSDWFP